MIPKIPYGDLLQDLVVKKNCYERYHENIACRI